MLESGPAAGAIAAAFFGREDSGGNLLAFDMGGTTAKLSLVDEGEPLTAYSFEAARQKRFVEGSGLSHPHLDHRADRDRRGRRQHRPRGRDRSPQGRAAERRLAAGARLLRPRRRRGHRDRRRPPARLSQPRLLRGRRDARSTSRPRGPRSSGSPRASGSRRPRSRGASTTSSTRTWRARRACTSPSAGRDPRDYALLATGGAGPVHA